MSSLRLSSPDRLRFIARGSALQVKKAGGGHYDPKQPRYPKGSEHAGEWMSAADIVKWKHGEALGDGTPASAVKDPETGKYGKPTTGPNALGADNSHGAAALDAKPSTAGASSSAKAPASILDYPADYAYPKVTGAPPATALKTPKQIKVVSLRKGDVITVGGSTVSVVSNKKTADGHVLTVQHGDGKQVTLGGGDSYPADHTFEAVARTPHPQLVAAAKKEKAASGSHAAEKTPEAAEPHVEAPAAPAPAVASHVAESAPEPSAAPSPEPSAPAAASAPASILDYPADYAYPKVEGAPPATTLKAPKPIKAVSLRKGDVVNTPTGIRSVAANKANADGSRTLTLQRADGSQYKTSMAADGTLDAVARTPHPQLVAAAKKEKAQQATTATATPLASPAVEVPEVTAPVAPESPKVTQTLYGDNGSTLDVLSDGTSIMHAGGVGTPLDEGTTAAVLKGGGMLDAPPSTPAVVPPAPPPSVPAAASILDYPADYAWPKVEGAPPATTLKTPKAIKVTSLRKGDVIKSNSGHTVAIVSNKKGANGKHTVTAITASGQVITATTGPGTTVTALARTPHPQAVAAAKKEKAAAAAAPATPAVHSFEPGTYHPVDAAEVSHVVINDDKTATVFDKNGEVLDKLQAGEVSQFFGPDALVPGAAPAADTGIPAGPLAGDVYTSPPAGDGTYNSIVVHADGSATLTLPDGTVSDTPLPPAQVSVIVGGGMWTKSVAPADASPSSLPAPGGPTSTLPDEPLPAAGQLSPTVPDSVKATAKLKSLNSSLVKQGSVVTLPDGGTAVVAASGKWEQSKGKYVLYGFPSADASPEVLAGEKQPDGSVELTPGKVYSQVGLITKANLKGLGLTVSPSTTAVTPETIKPADGGVPHVSTAGFTNAGGQTGSNLGGLFKSPTGDSYYVKAPADATHAQNEVLANRLYKQAGVAVPDVAVADLTPGILTGKGEGVASSIVAGKKDLASKFKDPAYNKALKQDFAVHAWLGNWDAVGAGKDNIITGADGKPVMVDGGGSLLYRAQGQPKGAEFGNDVTELKSMLDPSKNSQTAQVYAGLKTDASDPDYVAGVQKVLAVSPEQIDSMVNSTMQSLTPAQRKDLADRLKMRRKFLADSIAQKTPENKPANYPIVNVAGGTPRPFTNSLTNPQSDQVTINGKDQWFHTAEVGATSVKAGDVIRFDGDPVAPYLVTKQAPKSEGGKVGIWGKANGTGPEKFLFVSSPSSGERKVAVQTEAPPGWTPPPPPEPAAPGKKLVPEAAKPIAEDPGTPGHKAKLDTMYSTLNRRKQLGQAYDTVSADGRKALAATGIKTQSQFVDHMEAISSQWDGSSNDTNPMMLAFHHAVANEFGLEDVAPWGGEQKDMNLKSNTAKHLAKYGAAYQVAARAIWQNTQNEFAKRGITHVQAYRHMSLTAPDETGDYGTASPPWAWTSGQHDDVNLRPLSSFAWNPKIGFGSTQLSATVPVSMVFSMGKTGPGGLTATEQELVTLGVKGVSWTVKGAVKPKKKSYSKEQYEADYPEWSPGALLATKALPTSGLLAYPNNLTEDWMKGSAWPYTDADGDLVGNVADMADLYPLVNLAALPELPVAKAAPAALLAQIAAGLNDPDDAPPTSGVGTKALIVDDASVQWIGIGR